MDDSTTEDDSGTREIILTEYRALRDEIVKKMDHRATFRVSALTLSLAAIGVGIERRSGILLLLVPVAVVLFNNIAAFQSAQISRLAHYIRDEIEPKLLKKYPNSIGWHTTNKDREKRFRETIFSYHLPNLLVVGLPSLVAIALSWTFLEFLWLTISLTVTDIGLLTYFAMNYYRLRFSL